MELAGRVAVVTGGASGIGAGMAAAFAEADMQVVVADIELASAEAVAERLAAEGYQVRAAYVDVTDAASMAELADHCFGALGGVHLLCNNAGVLLMGEQADMIDADWSWDLLGQRARRRSRPAGLSAPHAVPGRSRSRGQHGFGDGSGGLPRYADLRRQQGGDHLRLRGPA